MARGDRENPHFGSVLAKTFAVRMVRVFFEESLVVLIGIVIGGMTLLVTMIRSHRRV
jgi:hypothetical protein